MKNAGVHSISKSTSGILGFDEITGGGLPNCRTSLIIGEAGSGKTTFALQFLVNGARENAEPGIFVAFEERPNQIIENAASFGWNLSKLTPQKLFFLDARIDSDTIIGGDFDLAAVLLGIESKVKSLKAKRIVFDSIDILLGLLGSKARQQAELFRLRDWISRLGLTGLVTGKLVPKSAIENIGLAMLPYITDCVVRLDHSVNESQSRRSMRVVKYRGSAFKEGELPFVIDSTGIEVINLGRLPTPKDITVGTKRCSSGVARLDTMLGGGYFYGSSILITGAPGTMKSTLAGSFVDANCTNRKRAVYLSFDELSGETIRNFRSIGIDLGKHVTAGRLLMLVERTGGSSPEQALVRLHKALMVFRPEFLVIDPISALVRSVNDPSSSKLAEQAINIAKSLGVTIVCTSLIESPFADHEGSPVQISSIADTWIHVSYLSKSGERNRALTIVKSRGTAHSNQIRELVVGHDNRITLADVYISDGEVLMGTLRWQKESADRANEDKMGKELITQQAELKLAEAELEIKKLKLAELISSADNRKNQTQAYLPELETLRRGDSQRK